jgi:DNA processing protein
MAEISEEALIAHIISTKKLLKPRQALLAYKSIKSFKNIWLHPWSIAPHIISPNQAQTISNQSCTLVLAAEEKYLQEQDVSLCAYGERSYPRLLNHIHSPPTVLYVRGNISLHDVPLAVIGSRKVSEYGKAAIESFMSGFAGLSMSIISGMALGADAAAHCAAVRYGLHTVGVLGSGIDDLSMYPRSHTTLARRIIDNGGGLISEYPPGTMARPEHFPMRNRIIAGMSHAVLVVEAAARSGTLITAHAALEDGRDVWAVPGSIFSSLSSGTNQLISEGSYVAQSSKSIIERYPVLSVSPSGSTKDIVDQIMRDEQLMI